ncbi:MAG: hypothetical protein L0K08_05455 [Bifidobacterium mongoliense]|nr:hypothetical protein [Bifidobacterium mongoliense]
MTIAITATIDTTPTINGTDMELTAAAIADAARVAIATVCLVMVADVRAAVAAAFFAACCALFLAAMPTVCFAVRCAAF